MYNVTVQSYNYGNQPEQFCPYGSYPLMQRHSLDPATLDDMAGHGWQLVLPVDDLNVPSRQAKQTWKFY